MNYQSIAESTPVFGALREDTLRYLFQVAEKVSVPKGCFFFKQGDGCDGMYILTRGRVAIVKIARGRHRVLRDLSAGDCFGELSLIDFCARSASSLAVEDCEAILVSNDNLYDVYRYDAEQYTLMLMNMGRELCRRLRSADERLMRLAPPMPEAKRPNALA